ncbi:hypothetical protein XA68_13097 [Ophiocordyceps unilateralis]|uniref:Chromo domain-containing protein n=1 Tax=Ophiocordyceps unilateralis TaxID=268505 RepID=A0A2A9PD91_OPHUN|nr:hypothetical protein XA68_13097 [Ophiocordyceps unilateralis]
MGRHVTRAKPLAAGSASASTKHRPSRSASRTSRRTTPALTPARGASVASQRGTGGKLPLMKQRQKQARKQKTPGEEWFTIRGILQERRIKGRVEYLVDWDDNIITGEAYNPTWTLSRDVTDEAKSEWEAKKATPAASGNQLKESSEEKYSQPAVSVRRSKRKRADAPFLNSFTSSLPQVTEERPRKTPRIKHGITPSKEPVPSITSGPSLDSRVGSGPGPAPAIHRPQRLVVEITKPPNFDPSEYLSVENTQLNDNTSSQSFAEREQTDQNLVLATEGSGLTTIPDSQEPSGKTYSYSHLSTAGIRPLPGSPQEGDEAQPSSSRADDQFTAPPSPEFATQPPTSHIFAVPESSSLTKESATSSSNLVAATQTDGSQHSTGDYLRGGHVGAEVHDTQVQVENDGAELHDAQLEDDSAELHVAQLEDASTQVHETQAQVEDDSAQLHGVQVEDASAPVHETQVQVENDSAQLHTAQAEDDGAQFPGAQVEDERAQSQGAQIENDSAQLHNTPVEDDRPDLPDTRVGAISQGDQIEGITAGSPEPQDVEVKERSTGSSDVHIDASEEPLGVKIEEPSDGSPDIKIEDADVDIQDIQDVRARRLSPDFIQASDVAVGGLENLEDSSDGSPDVHIRYILRVRAQLSYDTIQESDGEIGGFDIAEDARDWSPDVDIEDLDDLEGYDAASEASTVIIIPEASPEPLGIKIESDSDGSLDVEFEDLDNLENQENTNPEPLGVKIENASDGSPHVDFEDYQDYEDASDASTDIFVRYASPEPLGIKIENDSDGSPDVEIEDFQVYQDPEDASDASTDIFVRYASPESLGIKIENGSPDVEIEDLEELPDYEDAIEGSPDVEIEDLGDLPDYEDAIGGSPDIVIRDAVDEPLNAGIQDAQIGDRGHSRYTPDSFSDYGIGLQELLRTGYSPASPSPIRDWSSFSPSSPSRPPDDNMSDEPQDLSPPNQEVAAGGAIQTTPRVTRESVVQHLTSMMDWTSPSTGHTPGFPQPTGPGQAEPSPYQTRLRRTIQGYFSESYLGTPEPLMADSSQHATVSPADISNPATISTPNLATSSVPNLATISTPNVETISAPNLETISTPNLETSNIFDSSAQAPPQMGQGDPPEQASSQSSTDAGLSLAQREHVVTLPFQSSQRPIYDEVLVNSKRVVTELSTIFNGDTWVEPTESLVSKVDELLGRLFNTCDFPPDVIGSALAGLPPRQLARYLCDAGSKFIFIFELLQGVRKDTRFLIIARSDALLRLLSHLAEALEVEWTCEAMGKRQSAISASAARVTLALPGDDTNGSDYDVVIGFDHSYAAWRASSSLSSEAAGFGAKKPLMLHLVTTHTIEHFNQHLPQELTSVERKHALLSGVVNARPLINDPERGYPEPHEVAGTFVDYINGSTDTIAYLPIPIPDVLDPSPSQTETDGLLQDDGRKRKHDGTNDEHAKRARLLSNGPTVGENEPPLPDDVQTLLGRVEAAEPSDVRVNVSLSVLQALAEKFVECERRAAANDAEQEYKAVISRLEEQVKDHERTTEKIYKAHRKALEDRSTFEAEKCKADAAVEAVEKATRIEVEKKQKRVEELEAVVARLTSDLDVGESPLARTNRLLEEANSRERQLEKRLENAKAETEYAMNRYQEASSAASASQTEVSGLQADVELLQRKASDNLVRVQEIQQQSEVRIMAQENAGLKSQIQERDREMERVREELRQLKNGRRETRQVSVPRSPRTGVMSPRPHGRAYGGSGSRGTSPGAGPALDAAGTSSGAQFMSAQQPGNGRWSHLRD